MNVRTRVECGLITAKIIVQIFQKGFVSSVGIATLVCLSFFDCMYCFIINSIMNRVCTRPKIRTILRFKYSNFL